MKFLAMPLITSLVSVPYDGYSDLLTVAQH